MTNGYGGIHARPGAMHAPATVPDTSGSAAWNKIRAVESAARLEDVNPHMALGLAESAACEPTDWERWIDDVERILGHSADGDQTEDGYSLDGLLEQWEAGTSVADAVAAVIASKAAIGPRDGSADDDAFVCECGATADDEGFTFCLEDGTPIEPSADSKWAGHYRCNACGRVVLLSVTL